MADPLDDIYSPENIARSRARAAQIRRSVARGTMTPVWGEVAASIERDAYERETRTGEHATPGAELTGVGDRSPIDQDGVPVLPIEGNRTGTGEFTLGDMTVRYLSLQGVADHLGVSRNTVAKLRLPDPDVVVGEDLNARRGWSVATIDAWNAQRPGPGNWGPRGSKE